MARLDSRRTARGHVVAVCALALAYGLSVAAEPRLVSETVTGAAAGGTPDWPFSISGDGAFVLFWSAATDVVPGQVDTNGTFDLFLHETASGRRTLISHAPGQPLVTANGRSWFGTLSDDGSYVAFRSNATYLVPGQVESNNGDDLFVWERATGQITLASHHPVYLTLTGSEPLDVFQADRPFMSADGRYTVYVSRAAITIPDAVGSGLCVILYDRVTNTNRLVNHAYDGAHFVSNGIGVEPRLSADGRFVVYASYSNDLVEGLVKQHTLSDVYVFDRLTGTNTLVNHLPGQPLKTSLQPARQPVISSDGSTIAYLSSSRDIAPPAPSQGLLAPYVYDRATGINRLAHPAVVPVVPVPNASSYNILSGIPLAISDHGETLAFTSWLFDLTTGQRTRFAYRAGAPGTPANSGVIWPTLSGSGHQVAYASAATDLVTGQVDTNNGMDVFLFDLDSGTNRLLSHALGLPTTTGNGQSWPPSISSKGNVVMFQSGASNLVANDANGGLDAFWFDADSAAAFADEGPGLGVWVD